MMLNEKLTKVINLEHKINTTFNEVFGLPEKDYYANLDLEKLIKLKSALSDINSAIAIKLALEFLKWVSVALKLSEIEIAKIRNEILQEARRHHQYDIEHRANDTKKSFIAEATCRIPLLEGNHYGGAQKIRFRKDIETLLEAKNHSYEYRFMVFLDRPDIREANHHLISSCSKLASHFTFIENLESLPNHPNHVVYGIYVKLGV